MHFARIAIVAVVLFGGNIVSRADEPLDYPAGRNGVNHVSAGKAGNLRVFDCETTDTAETVILWYAKRLKLNVDHSLFVAASNGFDRLEGDNHFQYGFGYDSDDRRDHTSVVAHVLGGHAHVSFLHRPDIRLSSIVTISIAETPAGTSVHVIRTDGEHTLKRPRNTE